MIPKKTAKEYAGALYDLARELGAEEDFYNQLVLVRDSFRDNPAYRTVLLCPQIPLCERKQAFCEAFGDALHDYVLSFMQILITKGHLRFFDLIFSCFEDVYHLDRNIVTGEVVSAATLSPEQKQALTEKLENQYHKKFELGYSVDASLIGGMLLRFGDRVIDGSVKGRLAELKGVMTGEQNT